MKILVDADACPVKNIIVKIAKSLNIQVLMFADTSHIITDEYSTVFVVDQSPDAVDLALINKVAKGDIVVTQDYGVATMALGKEAKAIGPTGLIYSNKNIDQLLFVRHMSQKIRRSGGKTSGPKKRTKNDNSHFEAQLKLLVEL